MAKIPVYQSQVGAETPSALPQQNLGVASAPGRAMQGLGESLGGVGGQILKLAEIRNARVRNIKALNLTTDYSREVHEITTKAQELEGSDALGVYQTHQKSLEDLGKKYEQGIDDPLVLEQFNAFKAQANESSLNRVASHESAQTKVATKAAIDNLVATTENMVTANPDAGLVDKRLEFINAEIDLHYSGEIATGMKDDAALKIRANYMVALGDKNPKAALSYLEDLKASGKIDAQNYFNIKGRLDSRNDEVALEQFERAMGGMSSFQAVRVLENPAKRDAFAKKHGITTLTTKQAVALSNIFEGRARWQDYQDRQAKADLQEANFNTISKLLDEGDIVGAEKLRNKADLGGNHRTILNSSFREIEINRLADEQSDLYIKIDNGTISTKERLEVSLRPVLRLGEKGKRVAESIRAAFASQRVDDAKNYDLADKLYKNALKEKKIGFESKPVDFLIHLRETCTAQNIHGDAIVKKAQDLIGYVEDVPWGRDKIKSTFRKMEQEGTAGPKKKPQAAQAKKPATSNADLLKGYDAKDIEGAKEAIQRDYPNLAVTPERIKKVLDANR